MKNFYIFFLLLFVINSAMSQWEPQNSGTTKTLRSVFFTDANTGYAVGDSGTILKTSNGGTNWVSQNPGLTGDLYSVHFPRPDTGYIVSLDSTILKTTNGGNTWTIKYSGNSGLLRSIFFTDADTGYIAGNKLPPEFTGFILKTTNGGIDWTEIWTDTFPRRILNSIFFPDANNGFVVGVIPFMTGWYDDIILRTEDAGNNWTRQDANLGYMTLLSAYFINADTGYAVGYGSDASIIKTTDGGINWTNQYAQFFRFNSVFFNSASIGFVVGEYGTILKTWDGGINWLSQVSGITNELYSVCFPSHDTGYIVGENGVVLKTTNGGTVGIQKTPSGSNCLKIFPNPSSGIITIEITDKGQLYILNLTGQGLLKKTILEPNSTIDVSAFPGGVYLVKFVEGNEVRVGKFVKE